MFILRVIYRMLQKKKRIDIFRILGEKFEELGENNLAFRYYLKTVSLDPSNIKASLHLVRHWIIRLNFQEARNQIEKVLCVCPDDPEAMYYLAIIKMTTRDLETAARCFYKAYKGFKGKNQEKANKALYYIRLIKELGMIR